MWLGHVDLVRKHNAGAGQSALGAVVSSAGDICRVIGGGITVALDRGMRLRKLRVSKQQRQFADAGAAAVPAAAKGFRVLE